MKTKSTTMKLLATGLALVLPAGALSQTSTTDSADKPAGEQITSNGLVLEEVLVTVSKRETSVQDLAASVVPLGSNLVEDFNIQSVDDIAKTIPNFLAKTPEKLSIRGIAASGYQGSNAPQPVAQHENGLFIAETGLVFPYFDIASIEVLRGPSGTVFGRNATAGAIDVRWKKPEQELTGAIDYQWRRNELDNDGSRVRGFINVPIADERLDMRAAFAYDDVEATYDNLSASSDDDPNAKTREWYRLYLTSDLNEDVSLGLRYVYLKDDRNQLVNSTPLEIRQSGLLEDLGVTPPSLTDVTKVDSGIIGNPSDDIREEFKTEGGSRLNRLDGDISWNLADIPVLGDIELFLIAGVSDSSNDILVDTDGTAGVLLDTYNEFDRDQTTAEFRVSSTGEGAVQWIAGLFYSDFDMDVNVALDGTAIDSGLAISLTGTSPQSTHNEARAAYLSMEVNLAQIMDSGPELVLFGGIRANRDKTELSGDQVLATTSAFPLGFPDSSFPLVIDIGKGEFEGDESFSKTTGELGARWSISDNAMTYLKYSNGYKAGKLQQIGDGSVGKVDPEELDAYEIGLKSRWLDGSLQFNMAAFYYDYTDLQITQLLDALPLVENAADATIEGIEIDLQYIPIENLTLMASVGYMSTKFEEFCAQDPYAPSASADPGCSDDKPQNLSGNELPDAPKWSSSLIAQYDLGLNDLGRVLFSLRSTYHDDFYMRPQNLDIDTVDSYTQTDIRARWSSPQAHYEVELFVENLEDEDDIFLSNVTLSSPGMMSLLDHVPGRRYGVMLRYNLF